MSRCVSRLKLCMGGNGIQSHKNLVAQREHRLEFTLCVPQGHSCPILSRMCPIRESSKAYPDKSHLENDSRQMTVTKLAFFTIIVSLHDVKYCFIIFQILFHVPSCSSMCSLICIHLLIFQFSFFY